ncbi:MAG: hypothetical protein ACXVBR_18280 [Flavisolibacter sp.]
MTLSKTLILIFFTLVFSRSTNGQGRVDTDPILHNIWWTTWKIDSDKTLTKKISSKRNAANPNSSFVYYYKKDTLCKAIQLTKLSLGTEKKTFYFYDSKPILIAVKRNNFVFSNDQNQFSKTISSFDDFVDTSRLNKKSPYNIFYEANYYFDKEKVRYANVMTKGKIRVDKKDDITEALKLYRGSKNIMLDK